MAARPQPKAPSKPETIPLPETVPVPGAKALTGHPLDNARAKRADPPLDAPAGSAVDASTGAPADAGTDGSAGAREDARVDAPVREGVGVSVDAPEMAAEGLMGVPETEEAREGSPAPQKPSQGPRRMLEVKARAYRGGWDKLRPRAVALADAVRAVLEVGGTAAEVRGLLAEVGVPAEAIPPEVKEALRRRSGAPQG